LFLKRFEIVCLLIRNGLFTKYINISVRKIYFSKKNRETNTFIVLGQREAARQRIGAGLDKKLKYFCQKTIINQKNV
jgi:hypothetical protein